jgi:hypothetical protein
MANASFAKLLSLKAILVRDPDGADEIQVSRRDGAIFEQIRMRPDEVFEFLDGLGHARLLPFNPNQANIDIVLFEIDQSGPNTAQIGVASISASELQLGVRTQQIGGAGSLFELTYEVI